MTVKTRYYFSLIYILCAFAQNVSAQLPDSVALSNDTIMFFQSGNFKYKIPNNCVTSIGVQVWGGSGAGKGVASGASNGGGGGGGGAFSYATFTVTPGALYDLTVGAPGLGGAGNGGNGGDTWFGSTTTVLAKGGIGSAGTAGGAGGASGSGVGSVKFSGGTGGAYGGNGGGGGGASGNVSANGAAGSAGSGSNGGAGGAGPVGSGGAGGSNNGIGQDNSQCPGCGGGGGVGTNGGNGGNGSGGLIKIILPHPLNIGITGAQTICPGGTPTAFTSTVTGASGGPYTYGWQSSTADSVSGFSNIGAAANSTYTSGSLAVTTWFRCIANAGNCLPDTSNAIKVTVTNLSGTISFPQTICTGSTPSTLTITTIPSNVSASYVWQSSTTNANSGFATIGGAANATYTPGAVSAATWYNAIISATGCVTYTTTAVSVTTSNAPATCNSGNPSTIYSTNTLPLLKSSVGGSVSTGAWSILSSNPAGTHVLSSTAQTTDPASVTFTPQASYNGTVVLRLTTNSNGCNVSTCDKTINVIPATLTTVTFTNTGASTWTVPACVNTVTVQTWGAGGGGGSGGSTLQDDGSGGGGGGFSSSVISVTQGTVYNLFVGTGGVGAVHTASGKKGDNGGDSWFGSSSTVFAQGGIGGLGVGQPGYGSPSPGGLATAGRGQIKYKGGAGASGCLWIGGGGGGSAVPTGNGNDSPVAGTVNNCNGGASKSTPGATALPGGGGGGDGGESQGPSITGNCSQYMATAGGFPGGGGGGGTNACDQPGQPGAKGQVKIIYGPSLPVFIAVYGPKSICNGQSVTLTASSDFPVSYKWSNGITIDSITVAPTTSTTYTVIDLSGCASPVTAPVTVTTCTFCTNAVLTLKSAAGTDAQSLCGNAALTTITYTVSGGGTGATVTGLPAGINGAFANGTVTISGTASVTGTFNYSVTTSGGCAPVSKTGSISINPIPVITSGSASICAGSTATLTASGAGAGTYVWQPGSTTINPFVTPALNSPTSYTVTGTDANGCSANAVSNVSITPGLTITVASTTVCTGSSSPLTASGAVNYTWSPATFLDITTGSSVISTPSSTTTYTVVGDDNGCTGTTTAMVTVTPLDDPTFSYPTSSFCPPVSGAAATAVATEVTAGTYSMTPTNNLTLDANTGDLTIPVGATVAAYTITLKTNGACPSTSSITVNVVANPTTGFNYALPAYCKNATPNPTIILTGNSTGTFTASPAGLVFVSTATGEIDLSASTAGTYTVTNDLAAGGGCQANSSFTTVTINALPSIAVSSTVICDGSSGSITASGASSYTWSGDLDANDIISGADNETLTDNPASTAIYTVTGTSNGCSSTGQGTITVTPNPIVTVSNGSVCGGAPATITASGAMSYTWSAGVPSGAGNKDMTDTPAVTTVYTATGTTNGCTGTGTGTISINPTPTISSSNSTMCQGQPGGATLTANSSDVVNTTTYLWSNNQTTTSINISPLATQTYTVVGTVLGCKGTATGVVTVNPTPVISVTSTTVCSGTSATIAASSLTATSYTYTPGGTTANPLVVNPATTTTAYTVIGSIGGCNSAPVVGTINVNPIPQPTLTAAAPMICSGAAGLLTAASNIPGSTFTWTPPIGVGTNGNDPSPSIGVHTYSVVASALSCTNTASAVITVVGTPTLVTTGATVCPDVPATLTVSGANSYSWSNGSTAPSITVKNFGPTTYNVTGTSNGCSDVATALYDVTPAPHAAFSGPTTKVLLSEATVSFTNRSTNGDTWFWDFGDTAVSMEQDPIHHYSDTGVYVVWLKVTSLGGCSDYVQGEVQIVPDVLVYIPNAFTPNDDGLNDGFGFKGEGVGKGFEFRIFNRWGEQVFFSTDVKQLWKGDNKGIACPQDVYVYTISYKDSDRKDKKIMGSVNLIR